MTDAGDNETVGNTASNKALQALDEKVCAFLGEPALESRPLIRVRLGLLRLLGKASALEWDARKKRTHGYEMEAVELEQRAAELRDHHRHFQNEFATIQSKSR